MCAGNYANQQVALNGQVVDSINIILIIPITKSLVCAYIDVFISLLHSIWPQEKCSVKQLNYWKF